MKRRDYNRLFELMQEYQDQHPEASDDEAFEVACWMQTDHRAYQIDQMKDRKRDQHR
jgi:hypothetical protein